MIESSDLRMTRIPLSHGAGQMPALGFGTLIPDAALTITATRGRTGSRISTLRLRGTIRERARGRHGVAGRTCRRRDRARRHFCYHKAVELQSPARARRTGFQGESGETRARVSGSLSHSHSICISTRGRAGSAGSKRQCPLRPRRDFARHLESDGKSRGSWQVPGYRTFGHQFERTEAHL